MTTNDSRRLRGATVLAVAMLATASLALVGCGDEGSRPGGDPDGAVVRRDGGGVLPGTDGGSSGTDGAPATGTICEETCTYTDDGDCDDGAPGSDTSICDFGTDCIDCGTRDRSACVPDCAGRTCGSDGCFGTCGSCTAPETCMAGTCDVCTPACEGRTCGDDGCGGMCGAACAAGTECSFGACRAPMCMGRTCGSDGAGGRCSTATPECPMGMGCSDGACVACSCTGRMCGTIPGCTESCGTCAMGMLCDRITGMCSATATPPACNNTCAYAGDNECDDGRTGSHTSICMPGTDCADCGPMM